MSTKSSRLTPLFQRCAKVAALFVSSLGIQGNAAEFIVTSTADSGAGTLRQALIDASANAEPDTVRFAPSLAGATIALTTNSSYANLLTKFGPTGLVVNGDTVTMDGTDAPFLKVTGANMRRILAVTATGSLTTRNLTFSDGKAQGGKGGDGFGCGHGGGGGAGLGGGVWVEGSLQVIGCTFSSNMAVGGNGGAPGGQTGYSGTGGGGGGFGQNGQNGAQGGAGASPGGSGGQNYGDGSPGAFGGGGGGGGGSAEYAPSAYGVGAAGGFGGGTGGWSNTTVTSAPFGGAGSTGGGVGFSRSGGGGAALGGAIFVKNGVCSLVNSTFHGNQAIGGANSSGVVGSGAGSAHGGAVFNYQGQLSVINCTITNSSCNPTFVNASNAVSGISGATETVAKGTVSVFNSIIVTSSGNSIDAGFFTFKGGSFASSASGNNALGGVMSGITIKGYGYSSSKLGSLADNGGPTATVLPTSDSHVIFDYGDPSAAAGLLVDQRGQPRFAAGKIDVGSLQVTLGPPDVKSPLVTVSGLTAGLSAEVALEGASVVTERGFVWADAASNSDPLIDGAEVTRVIDANPGIGVFTAQLASLSPNTAYVCKAYATNSIGTAYTSAVNFTTNLAPVITSNGGADTATVTIAENSTSVTTVRATDADVPAQQISFTISGGADGAKFEINSISGALSFATAPDYEFPGDADGNGVFEVIVQVTDNGNTPKMDSQTLCVRLSDVAEAPLLTLATSASVTPTRATLGGTVVHDGGAGEEGMITERGVVFAMASLNEMPTLGGAGCESRITGGTTGVFTVAADELSPGTTYAYRAYATNASGTSYGPVATFTTIAGPALNGDFWTQVAGSSSGVSGVSNGTGTAARFYGPLGITQDSNGDLFVADTLSHTGRKIVGSSMAVSTQLGVAGTPGAADSALFVSPKFNTPSGIAAFTPASGPIRYYVADTGNHTIRLATWTFLGGWNVSTLAGSAGNAGSIDGTGTTARFHSPQGVATDSSGNVYVADTGNGSIRKITSTGVVTTVVPKVSSNAFYWGITIPGVAPSWTGSYTQLSPSYSHILGLRSDGTVAAWGINGVGETSVPVGLSGVTSVAAGHQHSLALKNNGTVVAWGLDDSGQSSVPTGLSGVTAIAAREHLSLALKSDGSVVAWGDNSHGQTSVPSSLANVSAISAGQFHCLALRADGTVAGWGDNTAGQSDSAIQQSITDAVAVAAGGYHSMALRADGTVVCWGNNNAGQCRVPAGLSSVQAIGAGNYFSYALKSDGTLISWGWNGAGVKTVPVGVLGRSVTSLAVGPSNVTVLINDELNAPAGVAVDGSDRLLIADTGNHVVRRYDPASSAVSIVAGRPGVTGAAEGVGTSALLDSPRGIAVDSAGNIYVTQTGDHTVRWITPDGRVRNVGGLAGTTGLATGAPENARFNAPGGIAAIGTTLYVADTGNNRIVRGNPLYRPMAGVGGASNVTTNSATLNGWVNPNGQTSTARFEYGAGDTFGITKNVTLAAPSSATGQIAQVDLTRLAMATTYSFRIVATNADGSTTSQTGSFTTAGPPVLAATPASTGIGMTSATLSGEVTSDGNMALTDVGFLITTAASPLTADPDSVLQLSLTGTSFGTGTFEIPVTSLVAGVTYRFCAYATNAAGTSYSDVGTFTTESFERVVFDNTSGKTRAFDGNANGLNPDLAFGYNFTTGNQGFDLTSITLGLRDFDPTTALRIRLFESGADSLPSGAAVATQDYPSQSFGSYFTYSYHTFPLSGFRLKPNTTYILFVGASSGNATWARWDPDVNPQSNAGWTINTMLVDSFGSYYSMQGNPNRWSIQLTATPFDATAPALGVAGISDIAATSASFSASVTSDGGATVTGSGFVYAPTSVNDMPEINGTGVTQVIASGSSSSFYASATGLAASTSYSVRSYATNSVGTSYSQVATFNTADAVQLSPSESWRKRHFGTTANAGNAADLAKPDGDGVPNLMKYALGLTPGQNGAGSLPKARIATNSGSRYLSLSFARDPSRNDVTIVVEVQSSIGGEWTEIARSVNGAPFTGIGGVTETDAAGGTKDVEIRDTQTVGSAARRFMRVRAER